jgi:ParB family chromosome partitioning protein
VHQAIENARQLKPDLRLLGHLVTRFDRRLTVHQTKDRGREALREFGTTDINQLIPEPKQPRVEFDDDELERLAQSIRDNGQLSPIKARWSDSHEKWIIVFGERRWRAASAPG